MSAPTPAQKAVEIMTAAERVAKAQRDARCASDRLRQARARLTAARKQTRDRVEADFQAWEHLTAARFSANATVRGAACGLFDLAAQFPALRFELADDRHQPLDGQVGDLGIVVRLVSDRVVDVADEVARGVGGGPAGDIGSERLHASPSLGLDNQSVGDGPRPDVEEASGAGHHTSKASLTDAQILERRAQARAALYRHHKPPMLHGLVTRHVAGVLLTARQWLQRRAWVRRAAMPWSRPSGTTTPGRQTPPAPANAAAEHAGVGTPSSVIHTGAELGGAR